MCNMYTITSYIVIFNYIRKVFNIQTGFLASECIVSLSLSVYFYFAEVYWGNYFSVPVYNVVLGPAAACSVVWGIPHHSWKTLGQPWSDNLWGCCLFDIFTYFHSCYIYATMFEQFMFINHRTLSRKCKLVHILIIQFLVDSNPNFQNVFVI